VKLLVSVRTLSGRSSQARTLFCTRVVMFDADEGVVFVYQVPAWQRCLDPTRISLLHSTLRLPLQLFGRASN
jgi:hypothetical protein